MPNSNLPSDQSQLAALERYQNDLAARARSIGQLISAAPSNIIRTKGKVFTLPDGTTSPGPLSAVIIDFSAFNSFFDGVYNPNAPKPPVCWAVGDLRDLVPSDAAPNKQSDTDCERCPKNQWGSSLTGKGKACKNQMKLAIIASDLATPDATHLWTINVSPSGIKGFSAFSRRVQQLFGPDALPIRVAVDIGFDPNQAYPTLTFANIRPNERLGVALDLLIPAQEMLRREPNAPGEDG